MAYNPNSVDSMFGVVVTRLDEQDKKLDRIIKAFEGADVRITSLEQSREVGRSQVALISTFVSALVGFIGWLLGHIGGSK